MAKKPHTGPAVQLEVQVLMIPSDYTSQYRLAHLQHVIQQILRNSLQLTKTHMLTPRVRRYYVADFDIVIGDDDAVDQQLNQASLLLEGGVG